MAMQDVMTVCCGELPSRGFSISKISG